MLYFTLLCTVLGYLMMNIFCAGRPDRKTKGCHFPARCHPESQQSHHVYRVSWLWLAHVLIAFMDRSRRAAKSKADKLAEYKRAREGGTRILKVSSASSALYNSNAHL